MPMRWRRIVDTAAFVLAVTLAIYVKYGLEGSSYGCSHSPSPSENTAGVNPNWVARQHYEAAPSPHRRADAARPSAQSPAGHNTTPAHRVDARIAKGRMVTGPTASMRWQANYSALSIRLAVRSVRWMRKITHTRERMTGRGYHDHGQSDCGICGALLALAITTTS